MVDLCTWTTLCTFLIYYTDVMGEDVYEGDPSAPQNSTEFINYQTGFKMGCYGLVEYSIFMSLGSAIIEKFDLFEKIPIKNIYALSYGIGKSEKNSSLKSNAPQKDMKFLVLPTRFGSNFICF